MCLCSVAALTKVLHDRGHCAVSEANVPDSGNACNISYNAGCMPLLCCYTLTKVQHDKVTF